MIFSISSIAQCTVRDLSLEDQKKILTKFYLLDECDSLRVVDSLHIFDLRNDKVILQQDVIETKEKLSKAKKLNWLFGGVGVLVGWIIRGNIK